MSPKFSSSDPEETPNSLDGEIGGFFTSLFPVSTIGLTGQIFGPERGPILQFSFKLHTISLAKGLRKR
jgi:hypothetical protein